MTQSLQSVNLLNNIKIVKPLGNPGSDFCTCNGLNVSDFSGSMVFLVSLVMLVLFCPIPIECTYTVFTRIYKKCDIFIEF